MNKLVACIKSLRHKLWLGFWRMMPIQQNKIIFWSDDFKTFGCNPKYIALYLAEHFPRKFDIVWVLDWDKSIPENFPEGIRLVRYFSMEYLKEIATSKVIVCNHRTSKRLFFHKRTGQYYIQTWHSSLRLKKIEGDTPALSNAYIANSKEDSRKIDLLLSGCKFSSDIFRRAFWYDGEILEIGTPRCDGFFQNTAAVREKVFAFFGISADQKLLLYAPTFRNDKKPSLYGFSPEQVQSALGEDWVVGCRLHPGISGDVAMGSARNMSKYPDMQELLIACDLLITDYSSSMFDMAVAGKPCALYVPDLDAYQAKERGLYFDIQKLPFPKAETMDALCCCLQNWDMDTYKNDLKQFCEQIGSFEKGNAAEAVAQRLDIICFGRNLQ